MARIIACSSYVARGQVGLSVITPALQALGHDAVALPSVVLSNHAGYRHVAGLALPPADLESMVAALEANGWLADVAAVLTGYLPSPDHVAVARHLVERVRALSPRAVYVCDPVLGDLPGGLYVSRHTAEAQRDRLVPLADISTPNAFELAWLSGHRVSTPAEAIVAAQSLPCPRIVATSVPVDDTRLATMLIEPGGAFGAITLRRPAVPNGTGDLLAGYLTGFLASGSTPADALARASACLERAMTLTAGRDVLTAGAERVARTGPAPALEAMT